MEQAFLLLLMLMMLVVMNAGVVVVVVLVRHILGCGLPDRDHCGLWWR